MPSQLIFLRVRGTLFLCAATVELRGRARSLEGTVLLVVPRVAKSTKEGRTFSYLAPKLWNSLPDNVRGSATLSLFKSRLKTHLFSQALI